jgi:hypothetical protein
MPSTAEAARAFNRRCDRLRRCSRGKPEGVTSPRVLSVSVGVGGQSCSHSLNTTRRTAHGQRGMSQGGSPNDFRRRPGTR